MIGRRLLIAAPFAAAMPALAQSEWPKGQPIRVLIPFAPGGVPDIISRIVTPKMAEGLGQSFVIDNKPGAGGDLAGQLLAQASPDGYTLMCGTVSTLSIVPAINPSLKYDPNSFAAIGLAAVVPMVVVVRAESPAQDMAGLIELIKSKPQFNYGSSGNGSILHLTAELFKLRTGLKMQHIPLSRLGAGVAGAALGRDRRGVRRARADHGPDQGGQAPAARPCDGAPLTR